MMAAIKWRLDREFRDRVGNVIRFLQRSLTDLESAKATELLPFFREPCLFQLSSAAVREDRQITDGRLVSLCLKHGQIYVSIQPLRAAECVVWILHSPEVPVLSVWRVNGVLDALQVNILGTDSQLYMQLGGKELLEVLLGSTGSGPTVPEIDEAVSIFHRNAMKLW